MTIARRLKHWLHGKLRGLALSILETTGAETAPEVLKVRYRDGNRLATARFLNVRRCAFELEHETSYLVLVDIYGNEAARFRADTVLRIRRGTVTPRLASLGPYDEVAA